MKPKGHECNEGSDALSRVICKEQQADREQPDEVLDAEQSALRGSGAVLQAENRNWFDGQKYSWW